MPKIEPIVDHLARARVNLLRAADAVSADQWKTRPSEGVWSAGEVVAHLIMVERTIVGHADRIQEKPPRLVPLLKRFHLPLALVESRLIRRKTPIPLDETMLREKEEMIAELRTIRDGSIAFLEKNKGRDLKEYRWPHPFLGMLNLYEWFQMIASHEIRHTKQMVEIASNLPKAVASMQK
ncbi:MAG: DinB family protein [Candidatus Acidiferrum sp.]